MGYWNLLGETPIRRQNSHNHYWLREPPEREPNPTTSIYFLEQKSTTSGTGHPSKHGIFGTSTRNILGEAPIRRHFRNAHTIIMGYRNLRGENPIRRHFRNKAPVQTGRKAFIMFISIA
ncbi:hypothetical protein DPMN_094939 [Dreissena polymorpha]|uniref:Uncharacterized protein n=1 Tax=Dreissena polymorpha TaxID=45954 RepID=A0A9D4L6L9_DREPO|nr:hypothetical protein DPMN_094939 [Dreissena polymorpha]